jgi:hypothetical protein
MKKISTNSGASKVDAKKNILLFFWKMAMTLKSRHKNQISTINNSSANWQMWWSLILWRRLCRTAQCLPRFSGAKNCGPDSNAITSSLDG